MAMQPNLPRRRRRCTARQPNHLVRCTATAATILLAGTTTFNNGTHQISTIAATAAQDSSYLNRRFVLGSSNEVDDRGGVDKSFLLSSGRRNRLLDHRTNRHTRKKTTAFHDRDDVDHSFEGGEEVTEKQQTFAVEYIELAGASTPVFPALQHRRLQRKESRKDKMPSVNQQQQQQRERDEEQSKEASEKKYKVPRDSGNDDDRPSTRKEKIKNNDLSRKEKKKTIEKSDDKLKEQQRQRYKQQSKEQYGKEKQEGTPSDPQSSSDFYKDNNARKKHQKEEEGDEILGKLSQRRKKAAVVNKKPSSPAEKYHEPKKHEKKNGKKNDAAEDGSFEKKDKAAVRQEQKSSADLDKSHRPKKEDSADKAQQQQDDKLSKKEKKGSDNQEKSDKREKKQQTEDDEKGKREDKLDKNDKKELKEQAASNQKEDAKDKLNKREKKETETLAEFTKKEKKALNHDDNRMPSAIVNGGDKLDKKGQKLLIEEEKKKIVVVGGKDDWHGSSSSANRSSNSGKSKSDTSSAWSSPDDGYWWGRSGCYCVKWDDDGWDNNGWDNNGWNDDDWHGNRRVMKERDAAITTGVAVSTDPVKGEISSDSATRDASIGSEVDSKGIETSHDVRKLGRVHNRDNWNYRMSKGKSKSTKMSKGSKQKRFKGSNKSSSRDKQMCVKWLCDPTLSPTLSPAYEIHPTLFPTVFPTISPTLSPALYPTLSPTWTPTLSPTFSPSLLPTNDPTSQPTKGPTGEPTKHPTEQPTDSPTSTPKIVTHHPTKKPTFRPVHDPTSKPTNEPTLNPTLSPSQDPTVTPTLQPTLYPTTNPTLYPTLNPTLDPTMNPTLDPTLNPTLDPSSTPTEQPTNQPTNSPASLPTPITPQPTVSPTASPAHSPKIEPTQSPTQSPTNAPTKDPTSEPTHEPTLNPTHSPSQDPTHNPTLQPTLYPTLHPTSAPALSPSSDPTMDPTLYPTSVPTLNPNLDPSSTPTKQPTNQPNNSPSDSPTKNPTFTAPPTNGPTTSPTESPTGSPTASPTKDPTSSPSQSPSKSPTMSPTKSPNDLPTVSPTSNPTNIPTLSPSQTSKDPTISPTLNPTNIPTLSPSQTSKGPTLSPSTGPSLIPTLSPTYDPKEFPTNSPSSSPTNSPSSSPTICEPSPEIDEDSTELVEPDDVVPGERYRFGNSIALTSTTAVIGAPFAESIPSKFHGAAYVFDLEFGEWKETSILNPSTNLAGGKETDECGTAVAVADDYALIGCPQENAENGNEKVGAVYIYKRNQAGNFVEFQPPLKPDPESESVTVSSLFGWSISFNGEVIAVGARGAREGKGSVFLYTFDEGKNEWTPADTLEPDDVLPTSLGNFGWDVALEEGTNNLLVGAPGPRPDGDGVVYVYKPRQNNIFKWDQFGDRLTPPPLAVESGIYHFGFSVAIDDSIALVGDPNAEVLGVQNAGAAYIYTIPDGNTGNAAYEQAIQARTPSAGAWYGNSVDLKDGRLVVGEPYKSGTGAVYLYYEDNKGAWLRSDEALPPNPDDEPDTDIEYGYAIAVTKDRLMAGAPMIDQGSVSGSTFAYIVVEENCDQPISLISQDKIFSSSANDVPVNRASLSIPGKRFLAWSSLTETERIVAEVYLGYSQNTWDKPGTSNLEDNSYDELYKNAKSGAISLGFSHDIWDCHINHYHAYWWADLQRDGIDQYLHVLGWDKNSWEGDEPDPETEDLYWDGLTPDQQAAAVQVCYHKDLWDMSPLSQWKS